MDVPRDRKASANKRTMHRRSAYSVEVTEKLVSRLHPENPAEQGQHSAALTLSCVSTQCLVRERYWINTRNGKNQSEFDVPAKRQHVDAEPRLRGINFMAEL